MHQAPFVRGKGLFWCLHLPGAPLGSVVMLISPAPFLRVLNVCPASTWRGTVQAAERAGGGGVGGADDLAARAAARRQADEREGAAEGASVLRAWQSQGGRMPFSVVILSGTRLCVTLQGSRIL